MVGGDGDDGGGGEGLRLWLLVECVICVFAISFKRIGVLHVRMGRALGYFMCSGIVYLSFSPQVHLLDKKFPETRPFFFFPDSS